MKGVGIVDPPTACTVDPRTACLTLTAARVLDGRICWLLGQVEELTWVCGWMLTNFDALALDAQILANRLQDERLA